jgi:iron complex transport system ATP-binding protein
MPWLHFVMPDTVSPMSDSPSSSIIVLDGVTVSRDGRSIVDNISLTIRQGERWVVLGANGCGKTTLLRIMSLYLHPSSGAVYVRGEQLGKMDVRTMRSQIAYSSASLAADLRPALLARDVVMTAKYGALEPWWHEYSDHDRQHALHCLERMGVAHFAERVFGSLSSGEQQRVLLARALMNDPIILLLDEPSARLDLGGREHLVGILEEFARSHPTLPSVLVTHHVDEIPRSTTHVLLMKNGRQVAGGPLESTLTSDNVSATFDISLCVEQRDNGRYTAFAT